jgi:hypothetical protein
MVRGVRSIQIPHYSEHEAMVSSVYHPLGSSRHLYYLQRKYYRIFAQEGNLDWDDDIPDKYKTNLAKWMKGLTEIGKVYVYQCLNPSHFGQVVSRQMHIFSDASFYGYGAVA